MDCPSRSTERKWIKSTPSPASLKEKVIRNCLSELKMKRKALFDEHRSAPNSSSKLLKAFVSDMYTSAKREENGGSLLRTTVFDDYSDNVEDNELMEQIEDAIRYEVERQIMLENQVFEFLENEEFATISLYEQGEYPVICPICRDSVMTISNTACTAICVCGTWLDLRLLRPVPNALSSSSSNLAPTENCGAALKQRLGDAFDRHSAFCQGALSHVGSNSSMSSNSVGGGSVGPGKAGERELKFMIGQDGHLFATCEFCGFVEQIT